MAAGPTDDSEVDPEIIRQAMQGLSRTHRFLKQPEDSSKTQILTATPPRRVRSASKRRHSASKRSVQPMSSSPPWHLMSPLGVLHVIHSRLGLTEFINALGERRQARRWPSEVG